jgi:hypothetical protein
MASSAFEQLDIRLTDIDDLMEAHSAVGGPSRGGRRRLHGVNRAAVLMLCAHLEGYVEDVFREALTAINPRLDPEPLVGRFNNPRPGEIDKLFRFIGMTNASRGIGRRGGVGLKDIKGHVRTRTVPESNRIREGIDSLVGKRNQIAHGATGVYVRKKLVVSYRGVVIGFARGFDEKVALHVSTITGGDLPWVPAHHAEDLRPLQRRVYIDRRRA